MDKRSIETRLAELEVACRRLEPAMEQRIQRQDQLVANMLEHFGRLQGQLAVMGYVASTVMQSVDEPVQTRLIACLQVAAENFPLGLPPHFEDGFRESAEALIPDIWSLH
nr:hypothetical protein [Pseudoxanthomonas sp.]